MRRIPALLVASALVWAPACTQALQARLPPAASTTTIEPATAPTVTAVPETATVAPSAPAVPPAPTGPTLPAGHDAWSATARNQLAVYAAPDPAAATVATFRDHNEFGDPQTFRVLEEGRGPRGGVWYHVLLPIQPNGASGWVRMRDVTIAGQDQRLLVDLSKRTMWRFDRGVEVGRWPVAIGASTTPTPTGASYVWTVWMPATGSDEDYGAGVLGMASMSPTLSEWRGGLPRIAIHGATRPSDLGRAVSHGCIRMLDDDLRPLLASVPLGTPVDVVA